MITMKNEELINVKGGINITGTFISSLVKGIGTMLDLGRSFGTAIRRWMNGSVCSV